MKLSHAEGEKQKEDEKRKYWFGEFASTSSSIFTTENNAQDIVRTNEIKCEGRSRVGGGSGLRGLYEPRGKNRNASEHPGAGRLTSEMKGFNALNLQPATTNGHPLQEMKRHRRTRMTPLARLELVLPPVDEHRRSRVKAEEVERLREEVPDVRSPEPSDSASAGSSVRALKFLQYATRSQEDDSSEGERLESEAPTCPSIILECDGDSESVGSSSVTT